MPRLLGAIIRRSQASHPEPVVTDVSAAFRIECEWLPGDHADAAERRTFAEIAIGVGQWCATELIDVRTKTVRSSARLSALHLAEWFAANWWRLLWEPRADTHSWKSSHRVGNAGHGYVWPDLTFSSDWQWVRVESRPTVRPAWEPIRYLSGFDHLVALRDFERGVDDFVSGTVGRLSDVHAASPLLSTLWSDVVRERADPEMSALRALEACMGYDPGEAPSDLLGGLRSRSGSLGTEAIREMAAAHKEETPARLDALEGSARDYCVTVQVPRVDAVRSMLAGRSNGSEAPWRRARRAAEIAREVWDLTPPIPTKTLCDLMDIRPAECLDDQSHGGNVPLVGLRGPGARDTLRVLLSGNLETSRRFNLARLVADHIAADEDDRLLPATRCLTSRQSFQRAFAQELLCPFDLLRERVRPDSPDGEDILDAARQFNVSPLLVSTTLASNGVEDRETVDARIA